MVGLGRYSTDEISPSLISKPILVGVQIVHSILFRCLYQSQQNFWYTTSFNLHFTLLIDLSLLLLLSDREVVLRSIITLLSKGSSRKRTADEALLDTNCLNTKKGIKGRLSTVEKPPSFSESLSQQSISAPVQSSGDPISVIQPPSASPLRAHLSASASPPAGEDVESLKLEVERLRKALEEQRAGSALVRFESNPSFFLYS